MEKWFNKTVEETEEYLQTDIKEGLTTIEAQKRQQENGFNELKAQKKKSLFIKIAKQDILQ